jgi:radical SAM protein with 4Fe4S-binding SPASM domain
MALKQCQEVEFFSEYPIDTHWIRSQIQSSGEFEPDVKQDMLLRLDTFVGQQEVDYLKRNGTDRFARYVTHRYKFKVYPRVHKLNPFPLNLLIEPTSACNLRCIMCFQVDPTFTTKEYMGTMDFEFFKTLIDQAVENQCGSITLASRGEPTLHKRFGDMVEYCRGKFLEVKINTNATRLNEKLCHQILDAGVDIVVFSIDSFYKEEFERIRVGANFEQVLANVDRFCRIKNSDPKYYKTTTRVYGVYLESQHQDKERFWQFWKDRVDSVAFTDGVERWDTYNNPVLNLDKPCGVMWERMYVWHDGLCNPCDYDYKSLLRLGNAREKPLKDIWLGEMYSHFRNLSLTGQRSSIEPCKRCNVF